MLIHAIAVSTTKLVGPHASTTRAMIRATGASAAKNAKQALPLPLMRGARPNSSRNCPNRAGKATNFPNAAGSMLLNNNSSALASVRSVHARNFPSASAAGR